MPYDRNDDVPAGVKNLPADGITIWRKAFNAAMKQYGEEETAMKVAWAAAKKKYQKEGEEWKLKEGMDLSYEQTVEKLRQSLCDHFNVGAGQVAPDIWIVETFDDFVIFEIGEQYHRADYEVDDAGNITLSNVVKVERRVEYTPAPEETQLVQEEALPKTLLVSHAGRMTILEGTDKAAFRVRGLALVDDTVSANGYYYTKEGNDAIVEDTMSYLARGGKSTVYSRHEKASYGLPVGKVELLERVGNEIFYEARIAETAEGRDVQVLIREGVLGPTSIRSNDFRTRPVRVNGRQVMAVERATLHGIDLVEQASIARAGITKILTEGIVVEEVEEMDWKEISIEELKSNRPDLLEAYDVAKYGGVNGKIRKLEAEVEAEKSRAQALEEGQAAAIAQAVEAAKAPLLEQAQKLMAELEQHRLDEAIAGAVKGKPYADLLEAHLRHGAAFGATSVTRCVKAEDVTTEQVQAAEAVVESMKQAVLAESALQGESSFQGTVREDDSALTAAQKSILAMLA